MKEREAMIRSAVAVMRPRNGVDLTVQRLVDATEQVAPVTLSVREASNLVTLVAAAKRLAELTTAVAAKADGANQDIAALSYRLQEAESAWASAERRLHEIDRASVAFDLGG